VTPVEVKEEGSKENVIKFQMEKPNFPIPKPKNVDSRSQEIKCVDSSTHYQHKEEPQRSVVRPVQPTIQNKWERVLNQIQGGNSKYSDLLVNRSFTPDCQ
jgi:hypothetical protein